MSDDPRACGVPAAPARARSAGAQAGGTVGAIGDDQRLVRILTGELNPDIKTLATRLIITRLRIEIANDRTALPRAVDDLRRFFAENRFAHRDLAAFTGS